MAFKYNLLKNYLPHDEVSKIRRSLLSIAMPAIGENVLQMIFGIADTAFLGHYNWRAMTAAGMANQVIFILQAVAMAVAMGVTVLIANSIGANNKKQIELTTWHAFYLSLSLGLFLSFLSFYSKHLMILFPGVQKGLIILASDYLRIIFVAGPSFTMMFVLAGALRGAGNTRAPMIATGIANSINIFLDYSMIFGKFGFPEMGVKGAALATAISRTIGVTILIVSIIKSDVMRIKISRPSKWDNRTVLNIFKIGTPTAIENFMFSLGVLVFANILFMVGPQAYAAHRVGINIESLSFMPGWGISIAITALAGKFNGAAQIKKVIESVRQGWLLGLLFQVSVGIFMFLFPRYLILIFTDDPAIMAYAYLPVRIIGLFQVFLATDAALTGGLRGIGDTKFPMYVMAFSTWLVRIPVGFIMVKFFNLGLFGAWIGMMSDMVIRAISKYVRFSNGKWESTASKTRLAVNQTVLSQHQELTTEKMEVKD
ncbi:MAG: MATE family efflux transporter [Thermotogae bacterium]|nr:MATE family efflux transporter [Thermotogota bacterium]